MGPVMPASPCSDDRWKACSLRPAQSRHSSPHTSVLLQECQAAALEGALGQVGYQDLPVCPETMDHTSSRISLLPPLLTAHRGSLPFLSPSCVMLGTGAETGLSRGQPNLQIFFFPCLLLFLLSSLPPFFSSTSFFNPKKMQLKDIKQYCH